MTCPPPSSAGIFQPSFDDLPRVLPIFPLSGVLLLPRGRLPLNIFEPRYLAMVEDALKGNRLIGMVQPCSAATPPPVFSTGCAGRIVSFTENDNGRLLITLAGLCRFHVAEELETVRGYRRVAADWAPYRADMDECACPKLDRARLTTLLQAYFQKQALSVDWKAIEATPDERLLTSLAMVCPFSGCEKQALLEASTLQARSDIMFTLLEMAAAHTSEGETKPN